MPPKAVKYVKGRGNTLKDNTFVGSSEPQGMKTVDFNYEQFSPNATLDIMNKAEKELTRIAKNSIECSDLQDHGKLIDELGKAFEREGVLFDIIGSFFREIEKLLQVNTLQHSKIDSLEKQVEEGSIRESEWNKSQSSDLIKLREERDILDASLTKAKEQYSLVEKENAVLKDSLSAQSERHARKEFSVEEEDSHLFTHPSPEAAELKEARTTGTFSRTCTFCGKGNHYASQCFSRRQQISRLHKSLLFAVNGVRISSATDGVRDSSENQEGDKHDFDQVCSKPCSRISDKVSPHVYKNSLGKQNSRIWTHVPFDSLDPIARGPRFCPQQLSTEDQPIYDVCYLSGLRKYQGWKAKPKSSSDELNAHTCVN